MVLYYTDLLAKLWMIDYARSAPVKEVYGFRSIPRIARYVEAVYWSESRDLTGTRLWFGPKPEGFRAYPGVADMNFAHIATRVYSAGNNDLRPGQETKPPEVSRRALDWWDVHYGLIADYEPMYHLQNQIMKWSLATALLEDSKQAAYLGEDFVLVDHSQRFDRWLRKPRSCASTIRSSSFPRICGPRARKR